MTVVVDANVVAEGATVVVGRTVVGGAELVDATTAVVVVGWRESEAVEEQPAAMTRAATTLTMIGEWRDMGAK